MMVNQLMTILNQLETNYHGIVQNKVTSLRWIYQQYIWFDSFN